MIDAQAHVVAGQTRQQHAQVGQHVGQVQHLRPQRLAPREGEKLAHQRGGAVGVLLDVHDVGEGRVRRPVAGQQEVRRHDDGGEHVVEIMRDAAGELADRLHLLPLRHLRLERLLLGGVDGVDDRRLLGALAFVGVGDRAHVEADVALLVGGQDGVDRRDVGLVLLGLVERGRKARPVALVDDRVEAGAAVHRVAVDDAGKQRQERGVGAQDAAGSVDSGDRHRRGVEEAREADFRRAQIGGGILALRPVQHDGARRPRRAVPAGGRAVHEAHRKRLARHRRQVEIDDGVADRPRVGLDRPDQCHAVARHDFRKSDRAGREAGEVDAGPFGQRRVEIGDAAGRIGREEAGGRVVEMVDRLLQVEEETFLLGALGRNVGDLPCQQRLPLAGGAEAARPHPVPVGARFRAGTDGLRDAEFALAATPVAQPERQPLHGRRGFDVVGEMDLQRPHVGSRRRTRQLRIGLIGVQHAPPHVGDDEPLPHRVDIGLGQFVARRARRHLDEADGRGEQIADADHRQDTEKAEKERVAELIAHQRKNEGRAHQHDDEDDQARDRSRTRVLVDDGRRIEFAFAVPFHPWCVLPESCHAARAGMNHILSGRESPSGPLSRASRPPAAVSIARRPTFVPAAIILTT